MISLGIFFPLISLVAVKPKIQWRVIRLFLSSLVVYGLIQLICDALKLGFFTQFVFCLIFAFCETSNLEHVINNNSNQNFIFLKFLLDPVFLKGSGLTKRFFIRFAISIILVSVVARLHISIGFMTSCVIITFGFISTLILKQTSLLPDWMQEHWIIHNCRVILNLKKISSKSHFRKDVKFNLEKLKLADSKYAQLQARDDGEQKWLTGQSQANVLVIILEGAGEIHFRKGWLPKLAERRSKNIHIKNFISHQRNTNRGLYSLFSGRHPNLKEQMAKPDLVAQYGRMDIGVAEILKNNGYQTCFVQGAPSVFMCKDRFMPALGFDEVVGEEKYPKEWPRIKWGVDDHQVYKMAQLKIEELNSKQQPWMMATLSVSAHHPFQASNKELKNLEDAMRYADEELNIFLNILEDKGLLKNTIVFITNDEVATDGSHILAENLGCMTVLTPEKVQREIQTPFGQSDLAFSVCDYLKIDHESILGRSFFRSYQTERPLYFASLFQQKVFRFNKSMLSVLHYSGKSESFQLGDFDLNCLPVEFKSGRDAILDEFLEASDRGLSFLTSPVIMDIPLIVPNGEEVVKSPGFIKVGIKKGESVKLQFSGENNHLDMPLVVNWLIQDMKHKRSFKPNIIILPNSKGVFEKEFLSPDDSWYDLSIRVMANGNNNWILQDIQIAPLG